MPVTNSYIGRNQLQPDGSRQIHEYHEAVSGAVNRFNYVAPVGFDIDAQMAARVATVDELLAEEEIHDAIKQAYLGNNPDKIAEEQSQADFDRRVLGQIMTITDAHVVLVAYPMFQAVEGRGGATANQRADYLGVPRSEYDLMGNRFNDINGIVWFLEDEKNQIWEDPLEGWE